MDHLYGYAHDASFNYKDFDNQIATIDELFQFEMEEFKEKIKHQLLDQQDNIHEYHNTFDTLYRASEQVRFQQKYQATEQAKMAAEVHKKELEDAISKRFHKTGANIVEFNPPDIQVNADIEKYFLESLATGIPVFELIPPTIMQKAIHMFSSSSEDTSSGNRDGFTSSSQGNTTDSEHSGALSSHDSHSSSTGTSSGSSTGTSSGSSTSSAAPHIRRKPNRGITVKVGGRVVKKPSTVGSNSSQSIGSVSSICDEDHIDGTVTTTTTTTTTYETDEGVYTHTTVSNVQTTHEETDNNETTCVRTSNVTVIYDTPTEDPITYNEISTIEEVVTEVSDTVTTTESTSNIQITYDTPASDDSVIYTETKEVDVTETKVSDTAVTTEKTANVQISYDSSNVDSDYSYISNVETFKDGSVYEKEIDVQINYETSNETSIYTHSSNIEGSYEKTSNTTSYSKVVETEISQDNSITGTISNVNINTNTNSNNEVTYIRTSNIYTEVDDVPISYSNTTSECQSNIASGTPDCEYFSDVTYL